MPDPASSSPKARAQKATPAARKKIPVDALETAIDEEFGIVQKAAKRVGMTRTALHRRIKRSARLQAAVAAGRERLVDEAEDGLASAVQKREAWAITLALKTLGKTRGYVERQELDALFALVDKTPADMTDDELEQALARATSSRRP